MKTNSSILEVHNLQKNFSGLAAVSGATFDVERGSITALIGPNGAGKSTVFNIISGVYRSEGDGRIVFDGHRIDRLARHRIVRQGLVRTFQNTKSLSKISVLENMMLAAKDQPGEHLSELFVRPLAVRRREKQIQGTAMELLDLFHLTPLCNDYAGTLSGGQRKLLEFARALVTEPKLILLDEPLAGVNPSLGRSIIEYMKSLQRNQGVTFLFVEHDMAAVMSASDQVIVMGNGNVIASGTPDAVRADPLVRDAYLGRSGKSKSTPTEEEAQR